MLIDTLFKKNRDILDKLPVGIVITTQEGKIIEINKVILKMFGYSEEEFLKLTTHDFYCNPNDRKKVYQKLYIDNSGAEEILLKRKDNSNFWVRVTYVTHKSTEEGVYCLSVVEDITELKQAEQTRNLLQTIIKTITESPDFNSAIESTIKMLCGMTGWIYGEAWVPSADKKYLEFLLAWHNNGKKLEKLKIESKKIKFIPHEGFPGHVWASKKPQIIKDVTVVKKFPRSQIFRDSGIKSGIFIPIIANDELVAIIDLLSIEDYKEEKEEGIVELPSIIASQLGIFFKEKQLEERFRRLSYAIEQSTLSIIITDTKGNIEYANPRLFDISGYTWEEVIGKNTKIFQSGKTPPETYRGMWNTILSGNAWHGEFINKKKNGELFWEHATISPIKNDRGDIINFVAYKEDITKIKKLEEQLHQSQKMEAIGQLTGGIAHDFNNILTGIILNSELLKFKMGKDSPLRAHVEQIAEQALKSANLIQNLLTFSRKQPTNLRYVNMAEVIASTKKLLSRVIREDIELKINIPDNDLMIMADNVQIEHVIINLATNARDAMPNGGILTIEAAITEIDEKFIITHGYGKAGRYALITVTDTGIGMDEDIQKKIFEPFFTTKEAGKGTGLGLAMVYGIIKQHEGYINLYSKPGSGTEFNIYLPIKEPQDEEAKPEEEIIPKRGSEIILVSEDDESIRKTIITILENYGYKVIDAIDGDDALEKFVKNKDRIKLVVLDVIMPKKNGKEVYDAIQNMSSGIKVLFISGYTGDILQVKEITERGLNIISKPFTQVELLEKVRYILDARY